MVRYGDGARPGGSGTYGFGARSGRDYRDRDSKDRERDRPFRDAYGRSPARQRDAGGHRYGPLCQLLCTPPPLLRHLHAPPREEGRREGAARGGGGFQRKGRGSGKKRA